MIIKKIDQYRCDGCGVCDRTCMWDVIRVQEESHYRLSRGLHGLHVLRDILSQRGDSLA